jgi:hypothetical protein
MGSTIRHSHYIKEEMMNRGVQESRLEEAIALLVTVASMQA